MIKEHYTFVEINKQYGKDENYVYYKYKRAIELFNKGFIADDIRKLVFMDRTAFQRKAAKAVNFKDMDKFKEIINTAITMAKTYTKAVVYKWSEDEIYCHSIGNNCLICTINQIYNIENNCSISKTIQKLIKQNGVPDNAKTIA